MVNLDELIFRARELKPLPASVVRLAALVSSDEASLDEICDVIAYDQALTLSILRAANSAANGTAQRIKEVHEAVFRLGGARVLSLTISANTSKLLKRDARAYGLNEGELWLHSVAAATAAETLSEFARVSLPPETFTAALLHDVGKLVMSRFLDDNDLEKIHRAQTEGGLDPLAAESEILSVHHGELGGIIAQHWQLPERIVNGIIHHHTPEKGMDVICDAVYLSNIIAKRIDKTPEQAVIEPSADSLERLELKPSKIDTFVESAKRNFEIIKANYNAT